MLARSCNTVLYVLLMVLRSLMTARHRFNSSLSNPASPSIFRVLALLPALLLAPSVALAAPPHDRNNAAAFYRSPPLWRLNVTCPDRSHWMRDSPWIHNRCSFCLLLHPPPPHQPLSYQPPAGHCMK
jgi:hypothetical protein